MAEGGTGSEPRRLRLVRFGDKWSGPPSAAEELHADEVVEVVVGSGHDEQTEDWKRKALDYHRALSEGYGVEDGGVWEDRALTAEAELQQVRERTVAAVVEALREKAEDTSLMMATRETYGVALRYVVKRFGSSVSGGE